MAHHQATARPGRHREHGSGYTEGKRPMPTAGEDRMESIYHNPVGAQSGMPVEGEHEGGTRSRKPAHSSGHSNSSAKESEGRGKALNARSDAHAGMNHNAKAR